VAAGRASSATAIVQVTVSKLRKVLSPGLEPGGESQRLRSGPLGYRLTVGEGELDAEEFLSLGLLRGRRPVPPGAVSCSKALAPVRGPGPIVLHGQGGVGKTAGCRRLAARR
jgi:hypothetical protein